jgi:hypothetical protein
MVCRSAALSDLLEPAYRPAKLGSVEVWGKRWRSRSVVAMELDLSRNAR